jgi:hypothetical protein
MIYLIGINNHGLQHNGINCESLIMRNKFCKFLEDKIRKYNITLVVEEFNDDALKISRANIATIQTLADKMKVKHLFCEPSIQERQNKDIFSSGEILHNKLGIKFERTLDESEQKIFDKEIKKSFNTRERIWFEKIKKHTYKTIIFICGADHIKSFESLLIDKGYKSGVIIKYWGKSKNRLN